MRDVALVDSGGTNIASIAAALERVGARAGLTADPDRILSADRVILPGVGAAAGGMARLRRAGLVEVLQRVEAPLLGICLGMQLLFETCAEDGGGAALGLIPGTVDEIPAGPGIRVPHMGWNRLSGIAADPLTEGLRESDSAYFVHSYAARTGPHTLAAARHGIRMSAIVRAGTRWGVQFHPERSASAGRQLLRNFVLEVGR